MSDDPKAAPAPEPKAFDARTATPAEVDAQLRDLVKVERRRVGERRDAAFVAGLAREYESR